MPRVGGIKSFSIDGIDFAAKPGWEINLGRPKREVVTGDDGIHGYTQTSQPGTFQGMITVRPETDIDAILLAKDVTATIVGPNATYVMSEAVYVGDGAYSTDEGELEVLLSGEVSIDRGGDNG